jgi:hypothetical protein
MKFCVNVTLFKANKMPHFFSLLSKNESKLIKSPVCLSLCSPLITFEWLGRLS